MILVLFVALKLFFVLYFLCMEFSNFEHRLDFGLQIFLLNLMNFLNEMGVRVELKAKNLLVLLHEEFVLGLQKSILLPALIIQLNIPFFFIDFKQQFFYQAPSAYLFMVH